jgi:hypothetical protein
MAITPNWYFGDSGSLPLYGSNVLVSQDTPVIRNERGATSESRFSVGSYPTEDV